MPRSRHHSLRSCASPPLAKVPTIILCEARGLWLFWVIRGGIGLTRRLGADSSTRTPNERLDTLPRTRASQNDGPPPRQENLADHLSWCGAQAACGFSCSASKRSSFFQSVKAMAAILRANVRRAISGFIPFSSKAA